jgi:hypothetical protein
MIRKCADVSHYGKGSERHVWIVVDGITVDITADQFPDVTDSVIISADSPWHNALPLIEEDHPWSPHGDDEGYRRCVENEVYWVYEKVLPRYATFD